MKRAPSKVTGDGTVIIHGHNHGRTWDLEIILEVPTCTICDTHAHPIAAFVIHTGQPICSGCVAEYVNEEHR